MRDSKRSTPIIPIVGIVIVIFCWRAAILPAAEPAGVQNSGLSCEKYSLDNGMTVILHVDHSLPTAGINLWYRVGARNELPGRSGFAHLFEHLMFMGTKRVPGSSFDNLMEAGGGKNNASTALDRTNYYSSGPASILPTLLWLDADRLESLGPTMTKEKLDLQRDVVRNEIRQQVENRPYGRAYEQTYRLLYPAGHPYHNAVYGTHEDLEAASVNDVKDFFATFYTPDNCSLVVAGDFDPATIKPLIANLFGTLPRGKPASNRKVEPAKLDRVVRVTMLDKVQLPRIEFDYHSPAAYAEGDGEMELLASILGSGRDSRLYRRLVVKDQSAVSVSVEQDNAALGSVFRVIVSAKADADLTKVEAAIDEELALVLNEGPAADEVRQRAATTELGILRSLQDVRARADRLNEYEYYFGDPNSLERDLDRYRKASADGIRRWAKSVLTADARVITRVLPEQPKPVMSARDQRPANLTAGSFKAPEPIVVTLDNHVPVYIFPRHELPVASCWVLIEPGGTLEAPAKAGLGSLVAAMTQEGAGDRDSVAFAQAASNLGARIGSRSDVESLNLQLQVLSRNFEPAVKLLADATLRPRMQAADFQRVKALHLESLRRRVDQPQAVAAMLASRMLIDNSSRYAWPIEGTIASVTPLALDDVKAAHQEMLHNASLKILVAGDISPDQAKAVLNQAFGSWTGKTSVTQPLEPVPFRPAESVRMYFVDRPNSVQTVISLTAPAFGFSDPRRVEVSLSNLILGGSFTSRLNRNLREVHGYTYGIGSYLGTRRNYGTISVNTSVKADVTGMALKEMFVELRQFIGGNITAEEAGKARETFQSNLTDGFGTLDGLLANTRNLLLLGAPLDTTSQDMAKAATIDIKTLNTAAGQTISLNQSVLILVGDKKVILEQTKDLGGDPPIELDADGARRQ